MRKLILIIALSIIGIIAKAQEVKMESNKILSIEKLAEIKGDTLFIYKDLDKALEVLNKSKNHKPFKYVVIVKQQTNGNSGIGNYPYWQTAPNGNKVFLEGATTNLWIGKSYTTQ